LTYRVTLPSLALTSGYDPKVAVNIPTGRIVNFVGPAKDTRVLMACIGDQEFGIFASDLIYRGRQLNSAQGLA
jgi:hypothetical protein